MSNFAIYFLWIVTSLEGNWVKKDTIKMWGNGLRAAALGDFRFANVGNAFMHSARWGTVVAERRERAMRPTIRLPPYSAIDTHIVGASIARPLPHLVFCGGGFRFVERMNLLRHAATAYSGMHKCIPYGGYCFFMIPGVWCGGDGGVGRWGGGGLRRGRLFPHGGRRLRRPERWLRR